MISEPTQIDSMERTTHVAHASDAALKEVDSSSANLPSRYSGIIKLLIAVVILQLPSLFNPFIIDDYVYLETVHEMDWAKVHDIFVTSTMGAEASGVWWTPLGALPFYRPLTEMVFAADFFLWGMNPFGFHLTNLMLHMVCVFLVWKLAVRLFDRQEWALMSAIIFALHPVHSEALLWISGRFDLMVCGIVLASVLSYLRWQRSKGNGTRWLLLSLLGFVVGLGCKETALVLPGVLMGMEMLHSRGTWSRTCIVRLCVIASTFGVITLAYLALRFTLFGGLGTLPPPYGIDFSAPLTTARAIMWNLAQYLMDFAIFIQVDAIYSGDFWASHIVFTATLLTLSAAVIVIITGLAWRTLVFRVGMVWMAFFTAPTLLAMPGERNVYLASVGFALMVAAAYAGFRGRFGTTPGGMLWVKRSTVTAVCLLGFMTFAEQAVMWGVAASGEKVLRDLEALMPDPKLGTRVFVVNQCPLQAVGFDQAIRLRYNRPDLAGCALTLSPTLVASTMDVIVPTGLRSIRVERHGGVIFDSFIEKFTLFSQPIEGLPETAKRVGLEILDLPSSYDQLTAMEFQMPYPLDDPRLRIFIWNNQRIRGKLELPRLMDWARLDSWEPANSSHVDGFKRIVHPDIIE